MRLERLELHNFRSYEDLDLDLSGVRLASIVGENGAGKSSLLEAAVFALTGAKGMRSLDDFIRTGQEECRVALTFSTGGETYRLTRTRSSRNKGKTTLELARQDDSGLWAAEGTGARDTDERVRQILGVDEDTLLQTAIVAQGDAGSFFALTAAKRLESLGSILKLDERFGPLEERFKAQAAGAKANLEQARRDVERLEGDVEIWVAKREKLLDAQSDAEYANADVIAAEEATEAAKASLSTAREAAAGYELAIAKRDELQAQRRRLTGQQNMLAEEAADLQRRIGGRDDLKYDLTRKGDLEAERDKELRYREQDQATEADRRRLEQVRTTARARFDEATEEYRQADRRKHSVGEELAEARAAQERATKTTGGVRNRIRSIQEAQAPTCDRCGQEIADAALAATLDSLGLEIAEAVMRESAAIDAAEFKTLELADVGVLLIEAQDRGKERRAELEAAEAEIYNLPELTHRLGELTYLERELAALAEIPAKLATIATLEERLAVVQREAESLAVALADPAAADALVQAEKGVAVAQGARARLTEAEAKARDAEAALKTARQSLSEAEKAAARLEGEVASLAPCRDQLAETRWAVHMHEVEQADAETLRKAMGKGGIPKLIVQNVLLSLEVEVNELLALYEGSLAIRFEGEKETNAGTRESMEIMVFDGDHWRPFETFSGGERYRVASAMRLGLARLLAHRSGARVETLIVDEPEGLDAPGRAHLAAILARMAEDFGIVLLLTHYEDLKDAMPQQIVVSRGEDGLSRVEVAA